MAAILLSKISKKISKRKHFKLIVHWKLLKPILSEIDTFAKNAYAGHGNGSKKSTTNQSRATKFGR